MRAKLGRVQIPVGRGGGGHSGGKKIGRLQQLHSVLRSRVVVEFHQHLTRPGVKYSEKVSICLLESDLKMSKSHANVVSFDANASYLSTSTNLYERKEQLFLNETVSK